MNLTSLTIKNYMRVRDLTLTGLTGTTILVGPNGSGKSTVLRAVAHALSGATYDRRGKQVPARTAIGPYQDTAEVKLTLTHDGVEATVRLVVRQSGATLHVQPPCKDIWTLFKLDKDRGAVACHPSRTLITDDLLAKLNDDADTPLPDTTLRAVLGGQGDMLKAWVESELGGTYTPTAQALLSYGASAYALRTNHNRRIKEVEADLIRIPSTTKPLDKAGNLVDMSQLPPISARIAELNRRRDVVIRAQGAADNIARQRADLEALTAQQGAEPAKVNRTKLNAAEQEHSDLTSKQYSIQAQLDDIARRDTGPCPACGQEMGEESRQRLQERVIALKAELNTIDLKSALKRLTASRDEYNAAKTAHDAWTARADRITRLAAEIAEAEKVAALEDDLADLESRIARGEALAKAVRLWHDREALVRELDDLNKRVEFLTWACDTLRDPQRFAGVGGAAAEFADAANTVLGPFGCELRLDGGMLFRQGNRDWTPVDLCSDGEQWLIQAAIARGHAPGCVAVIDRADSLDGLYRKIAVDLMSGGSFLTASAQTDADADWNPDHVVYITEETCE